MIQFGISSFSGFSIFQFSFLLVFPPRAPSRSRSRWTRGLEDLTGSFQVVGWRPTQNKTHHIDHPYSSWWLNQPHLKNMSQNGFIFPMDQGENKKNIWN